MSWTRPADIQDYVRRMWERGRVLTDPQLFPLRVRFKGPGTAELANRFGEVQAWIAELRAGQHYRVEMRQLRHRQLGQNLIPSGVWVDTCADALAMLELETQFERYQNVVAATQKRCPALLPWLARRPLRALEVEWERVLDVVVWVVNNPRPDVFIRQVDFPGVHTKFIERHAGVLRELLELALPAEAIGDSSVFEKRFGFKEKSPRVRFRLLETPERGPSDLSLLSSDFAAMESSLRRVFILENEINFLTFPPVPDSLAIFGAGYGVQVISQAAWLADKEIHYWGDIDTHGLAILDHLRSFLPAARSLLMDRATLMAHREYWGYEHSQEQRLLTRLTPAEAALYEDLRCNALGDGVRLEQELVRFPLVLERLREVAQVGNCDRADGGGLRSRTL